MAIFSILILNSYLCIADHTFLPAVKLANRPAKAEPTGPVSLIITLPGGVGLG